MMMASVLSRSFIWAVSAVIYNKDFGAIKCASPISAGLLMIELLPSPLGEQYRKASTS